MVDVLDIFWGGCPNPTTVYLGWDRRTAVADYIIRRIGTLEVPESADLSLPQVTELPDTMPRFPRTHDRYYTDGGSHWPERVICSRSSPQ